MTDAQEKAAIVAAINRANGNISEAARDLDTPRRTLQRRMRHYGLAEGKRGRPKSPVPRKNIFYGKRSSGLGAAALVGAAVVGTALAIRSGRKRQG